MDKIIKPGTVDVTTPRGARLTVPVYCRIQITPIDDDNRNRTRLTISGVEGPRRDGNSEGSSGQIVIGHLPTDGYWIKPGDGWTRPAITKFLRTWDRWHLNDMRAGAPDQESALRDQRARGGLDNLPDYYAAACAYLDSCGILTSKSAGQIVVHGRSAVDASGYRYGSGWVYEPLPSDVVAYLESLPASPDAPPRI